MANALKKLQVGQSTREIMALHARGAFLSSAQQVMQNHVGRAAVAQGVKDEITKAVEVQLANEKLLMNTVRELKRSRDWKKVKRDMIAFVESVRAGKDGYSTQGINKHLAEFALYGVMQILLMMAAEDQEKKNVES